MDPIRTQQVNDFDPQEDLLDMNTIFDELRSELSSAPEVENVSYVVPKRPNIQVVFRPVIDFDQLRLWQKRARESKKPDAAMNEKRFMTMVLAETCVGIQLKRDDRWHDAPLTFKDRQLQEMIGATLGGYAACVEKMYSNDGHLIMVGKAVMEASGYTDFDFEGESDPLES